MSGRDNSAYLTRLFGPGAPRPVAGCAQCAEMARARGDLAARFDRSGVTETNVMWRNHLRQVHGLN